MGFDIGMVGLGVMGRNLLLNMADKGYKVAGYDRDSSKVEALRQEGAEKNIEGSYDIKEFIGLLSKPRAIMLLVPAGPTVDAVIAELIPLLDAEDILIDAGNSFYKDSNERASQLAQKGISFLSVGVSGGEEGARHGPSIMPSGPKAAYQRVESILKDVSAKAHEEPCVAYLGTGSAGHFVKMVHNGIEYGLMELISETYDILKRGLGLNDDEIHETFKAWTNTELSSYLIDITAKIFETKDTRTGKRLIDEILDVARQLGTGMWTSQTAMTLQVPTPTIDCAVAMRNLSMLEHIRKAAHAAMPSTIRKIEEDKAAFLTQLKNALYVGMIIVYAQGLSILTEAKKQLNYTYELSTITRIWREGCIIRSELLEIFSKFFQEEANLANLILHPSIAQIIIDKDNDIRDIISSVISSRIPIGAFMSVLAYLDSYRSGWLPANLIQAQRDFFGSHTFERTDATGFFHCHWEQND